MSRLLCKIALLTGRGNCATSGLAAHLGQPEFAVSCHQPRFEHRRAIPSLYVYEHHPRQDRDLLPSNSRVHQKELLNLGRQALAIAPMSRQLLAHERQLYDVSLPNWHSTH